MSDSLQRALTWDPRYKGPKRRLLWGIWVCSAPGILALFSARVLSLYDKGHPEHPLNAVTSVGVFGVLTLAYAAFVTSCVATICLVLLLVSRDVPVAAKTRGAVVVSFGWLISWAAWALLTRG